LFFKTQIDTCKFGNIVGDKIKVLHDGPYGPVALEKNRTVLIWRRLTDPDVASTNIPRGTHYFKWLPVTRMGKNNGGCDILALKWEDWS
jgi:hypothetical protein